MKFEGTATQPNLGDFILENMEAILVEWESFARKFWKGPLPDSKRLRDHAEVMLRALVKDMATSQNRAEQQTKSEGEEEDDGTAMAHAAMAHALGRVEDGFDIARTVAEFRALRASVTRLWVASVPTPHQAEIEDMGRFNEAVDQLVAASVAAFTDRIEHSKRLFLGILGHDLRQPLYSIKMFAEVLAKPVPPPGGIAPIVARIAKSCDGMAKLLGDLLDFTASELGSAMPVYPGATNLEEICREVLEEVRVTSPTVDFKLVTEGNANGHWDGSRLRQIISNLLSNATHHGSCDLPITLNLRATDHDVVIAVHNMGAPIPEESIANLFDPMVRLAGGESNRPQGSIGLGLYICRQIATAHRGDITVDSSKDTGTTFTVRLPKHGAVQMAAVIEAV